MGGKITAVCVDNLLHKEDQQLSFLETKVPNSDPLPVTTLSALHKTDKRLPQRSHINSLTSDIDLLQISNQIYMETK